MRNVYRPRVQRMEVDMEAAIGDRVSPHPDNSLAHRHWARWKPDAKGLLAYMKKAAAQGKVGHFRNEYLGLDRFLLSDGSMLVISFSSVRTVDMLCSQSLRTYFLSLGGVYAPTEAFFINQMRLTNQGWGHGTD